MGFLGVSFYTARAAQLLILLPTIGLAAKNIATTNSHHISPPTVLIVSIIISTFSILYSAFTTIIYYDSFLPFMSAATGDAIILLATAITTAVLGSPLPSTTCSSLNSTTPLVEFAKNSTSSTSSSTHFSISYTRLASSSPKTCLSLKGLWALSICVLLLYLFSSFILLILLRRDRLQSFPARTPSSIEKAMASSWPSSSVSSRDTMTSGLEKGSESSSLHSSSSKGRAVPHVVISPPTATHPLYGPRALGSRAVKPTPSRLYIPPVPPLPAHLRSEAPAPLNVPGKPWYPPPPTSEVRAAVAVSSIYDTDNSRRKLNLGMLAAPHDARSSYYPPSPMEPVSPLSPMLNQLREAAARARNWGSGSPGSPHGGIVETPVTPETPGRSRRTIFDIVGGWWDLNLIERKALQQQQQQQQQRRKTFMKSWI